MKTRHLQRGAVWRVLLAVGLVCVLGAPLAFAQIAPDLILYNANVVTLAGGQPRAQAVAITRNRITAVGTDAKILEGAGEATRFIDLAGATLIPGLIDNHVHYVRAAGGAAARFAETAARLNAQGVTGVVDVGGFNFTDDLLSPVRDLADRGELNPRVFHTVWLPAQNADAALRARESFPNLSRTPNRLLQRVGVGETLYLPLHDNPSRAFSPSDEETAVAAALVEALAENSLGLHLHTRTDQAARYFLDLFERAAPGVAGELGWTLHHLENITSETVRRLADSGVGAAVHPRGTRVTEVGGKPSLRPPVGLLEAEGVIWGLGTDATGSTRGLIDLMAWAVGEGEAGGVQNTVDRETALRALTLNNARLVGRQDELGSVEPDKIADLVVIDRDVTDPSEEISSTRVLITLVDGRIVFQNDP